MEQPTFLTIFLVIVMALCILVSGLLLPVFLFMRDTQAYGVLIWLDAALITLVFFFLVWTLRKRWAFHNFGMVDWKRAFQLFANVLGVGGVGALAALAMAGALVGSFRIDYGYLPLLGLLTAGAIGVGVGIGIGGLRKPP